jgi:hypothetical protein
MTTYPIEIPRRSFFTWDFDFVDAEFLGHSEGAVAFAVEAGAEG